MIKKLISLILIILTTHYSLHYFMPEGDYKAPEGTATFSNKLAQKHIENISKKEHFSGSENHNTVRQYIIKELQKLGLKTSVQEGYTYSSWGSFVKAKNILARIKGTQEGGKALMVLTHYDSAPHSSFGASDAGSGVGVILEGIRAFLEENKQPKNDIIILISDAEELGLNGARLFVNEHEWAKDVGLVLNFEARGSGGPSYMIMEVNNGNSAIIKEFKEAHPNYPVATSLAYSIYKELPNDTDLTVFREEGEIQGFNFAFIDDHYDYHTALDTAENLDNNTLTHQATYLMPLLSYFGNNSLSNLNSTEDEVYFNSPLGMHIYPFSWVLPLVIIAAILFLIVLFLGTQSSTFKMKQVGYGFIAFLLALIVTGCIGFFGWKGILSLYPDYNEILHGFPYNGHYYILFFVLLSLAICLFIYHKFYTKNNTKELLVAPLFFWIVINFIIALYLKGASFFIIPVFFGIGLLLILIRKEKPSLIALTLLSLPAILIYAQFIEQFPIALGLKMIVASTVFTTLTFALLLPFFGFVRRKKILSYLTFFITIAVFFKAHTQSDFTVERPKPNSLVYLKDHDTKSSYWLSYDHQLDDWNKDYFFNKLSIEDNTLSLGSKYGSLFKHMAEAPDKNIALPEISISKDTIIGNQRTVNICIAQQRKTSVINGFSDAKEQFSSFKINGKELKFKKATKGRASNDKNRDLFNYWVVDNEPLEIECSFPKDLQPNLELIHASFDLLNNSNFQIKKRPKNMIPKPFVINDAVLSKNTIKL